MDPRRLRKQKDSEMKNNLKNEITNALIENIFGELKPEKEVTKNTHRDIGKKVIIRTYSAGVHYGTLAEKNGMEVILENAIRIWYWDGAFTLSALAQVGTKKPSECKFSIAVDHITLEAIEIIPVSSEGQKSIEAVKPHE